MSYTPVWAGTPAAHQILAIAASVKTDHPDYWAEVQVPGQKSCKFISEVARRCQAANIPAGCNLKRGGPEISLDVLALPNATGCGDATGTFPGLELADIGMGFESSAAHLGWGDVTQVTIDAGVPGGWVASAESGHTQPPAPPVVTIPAFPPRNETLDAGLAFNAHYKAKGASANGTLGGNFPDPRFLDIEGEVVWLSEYLRRRQLGETHGDAVAHVIADIDKAWH